MQFLSRFSTELPLDATLDFAFQGTGVKFASVTPDSPAAKAGLKAGDVLIRLGGEEIADLARSFRTMVRELQLVVGQVKESSGSLNSSAKGLSNSAQQMSASTEEIAAAFGTVIAAQRRRLARVWRDRSVSKLNLHLLMLLITQRDGWGFSMLT